MNETDTRVDYLQGQLFARNRQLHDTIEHANDLTAELAALTAERDDLRGVVEKLPKTADGVTIVPGMRLWTSYNNGRVVAGFTTHDGRLTCIDFVEGFDKCVWAQYSTQAAAKAASED